MIRCGTTFLTPEYQTVVSLSKFFPKISIRQTCGSDSRIAVAEDLLKHGSSKTPIRTSSEDAMAQLPHIINQAVSACDKRFRLAIPEMSQFCCRLGRTPPIIWSFHR